MGTPPPIASLRTREFRAGLYASVVVPREYVVRVGLSAHANPASDDDYVWQDQRLLRAHEPNDICIADEWPSLNRGEPRHTFIKIKYWSPDVFYLMGDVNDDPPGWEELKAQISNWWRCPTDPLESYVVINDQLSGRGHWEIRARILYPDEFAEHPEQR
ncbi:hypothetical protein [Nonomuraea basaltis]|uniref:hypothetical protein n=1 Tax=Nonomuraea basaltis TaxID=2495887 RepID=UPI00110C415C|nr:hypothetical protein [Nonomuraea basaltis]TMR88003.1 hypothetical protein EJK15_68625 [Nonomuraea basaltis]